MNKSLSIMELVQFVSTEKKAVNWLEDIRWHGKPTCPHCGCCGDQVNPVQARRFLYWCRSCKSNFNVKTGTTMHATKLPLKVWVIAMYQVLVAKKGISAMQLSRELSISYKTAWYLLHRIREGCEQGDFQLSGEIEVDETYIGGKEKNKHLNKRMHSGRGCVGKAAVMGMQERGGKVRAMHIHKADGRTLHGVIYRYVSPGATVYTDEHRGYLGLGTLFYRHESVRHSTGQYVDGVIHTNSIESFWAVIKRGYMGVYHSFSVKHMQRYIDEFVFRFNNRGRDMLECIGALFMGMEGKRLKYQDLVR